MTDIKLSQFLEEAKPNPLPALNAHRETMPDQQAEIIHLSRKTGLTPDLVESSIDDIREQEKFNKVTASPKLSEFLSDDTNVRLAHDDIESLSKIDSMFSGNTASAGAARNISKGAVQVSDFGRATVSGAGFGLGSALTGLRSANDAAARLLTRGIDAVLPESADRFLWVQQDTPEALKKAAAFQDGTIDFFIGDAGEAAKEISDVVAPPVERQGFGDQIGQGLGNMSFQIAATIFSGGVGSAALVAQGVDQQAERQIDSGAIGDSATGDIALLGAGAGSAILEKVGLGKVLSKLPDKAKNDLTKKLVDVVATAGVEGGTEALEGVMQSAIEYATTNKDAEIFAGVPEDATLGAAVGGIARALVLSAVPSKNRQRRSTKEQGELDEIVDAAKETKLFSRDKETLENYLEKVTEGGNVFLPAEQAVELYQSEQELADEWGVDIEDVQEALAIGGDIAVPVSRFAANSDAKNFQVLRDIVRTTPDSLNLAELANTEIQEILEQDHKDIIAQEIPIEINASVGRDIENKITTQLIAAGTSPEVAATQSVVWRHFFETLDGKGVDAKATFERLGLQIGSDVEQGPRTTELDLLIDDIKAGRWLKEEDAFGPNLLEFVRDIGIRDDQGDLADRDINLSRKAFQRNVLREDGQALDDIAVSAYEAGYFDYVPDRNELIDAISENVGGNPTYSQANEDVDAIDRYNAMQALDDAIRDANIDINQDTAAVRELVQQSLNQGRIEGDGVTLNQEDGPFEVSDKTDTPEFKAWAGTNDAVIEPDEVNDFDFSGDGPFVLKAFHGTTHEFEAFDATRKGNKEGHFGAVNYFTTSEGDATDNYGESGPDLTNRIEQRADEAQGVLEDQFERGDREQVLNALKNKFSDFRFGELTEMSDGDAAFRASELIAENELQGGSEATLEVYIKTEKPFVIGTDSSPFIEFIDFEAIQNEAIEIVADDQGVSIEDVENNPDDYNELIYDARWDIENNTESELISAIEAVAARHDFDASELFGAVQEYSTEGLSHDALEKLIRENESIIYAESYDDGRLIGNHLIAEIIQELGFDSIVMKNANEQFKNMNMERGTSHIHVFDKNNTNIKSVDNKGTFDPNDDRILHQEKRASVTFSTDGVFSDSNVFVKLGEASDTTSFLHESSHIFLELYRELSADNDAISAEYDRIKEWLGADGEVLTRDQHEQFAEGFETYLFEGKAPSVELQSVFNKFRAWFMRVYRDLRNMRIQLDDTARDIFDSLLASEDAIDAARQHNNMRVSETLKGLMDEGLAEQYEKQVTKARQDAEQQLITKALKEIKNRESKEYKKTKRIVTDEVTAEVKVRPVYRAFDLLTKGEFATGETPETLKGIKLDKQSIVELRGKSILNRLLKGKRRVYATDGRGVHPDDVAAELGFTSGDELIWALSTAPKLQEAIANEVDAELKRRIGDYKTDGTMEREAAAAVHNDSRARVLMAEQNVIAQHALKGGMPLAVIKSSARNIIEFSPIKRVIKPAQYALNATNAGKRAIRLAAKGDYVGALKAKQQQLLNHELSRLSYKARDKVQSHERYLKKFNRKIDAKKINPEFIGKIKELLALEGTDGDGADILAFIDNAPDTHGVQAIPPHSLILNGRLKDRSEMTLDELQDYRDSVRSLERAGRRLSDESKESFNNYIEDLTTDIYAAWGDKTLKKFGRDDKSSRLPEILRQGDAEILRYPFLIEALQGGKEGRLIDDMETQLRKQLTDRNGRRDKLETEFAAILKRHDITQKELNKRYSLPQISGVSVKFEKVISVALNMGTEQNIDRIASDPSTSENIQEVFNMMDEHMEKRHWDAVQEIWDMIGSLWPESVAVEKRVSGVTPKGVEARQLQTKFGTYKGGYYPIKYDHKAPQNENIKKKSQDDAWKSLLAASPTRAKTKQGHLVERQRNVERPLDLSLGVVLQHIDEVTNDIYMREVAMNTNSIVSNKKFRNAVKETHGDEYLRTLETVLKRTVAGTERVQGPFDSVLRTTRVNASLAILGFKITTAALAPVSYAQTVIPRYGWKVVKSGVAQFYGRGPIGMVRNSKFINEKSFFMRERSQAITREAHEMVRKSGAQTNWDKFRASGFLLMAGVEKYTVSGPLWMGVYRDALERGKSDADAIIEADKSISTTQGSGLEIDQSLMQGDVEAKRLFTFMWGYMSGYYGTVRNDVASKEGFKKTWPVFKQFVMLNFAAANIETLIREGIGDEEDPYFANVLKYMQRNILGLIPAVSTVFSRYDSGPSVAGLGKQVIETSDALGNATEEIMDQGYVSGETAEKVAVRTAETLGFAFGVPGTLQAKQVYKTYTEDDDPTLYEAFISGPDKDN